MQWILYKTFFLLAVSQITLTIVGISLSDTVIVCIAGGLGLLAFANLYLLYRLDQIPKRNHLVMWFLVYLTFGCMALARAQPSLLAALVLQMAWAAGVSR